MSLKDNLTINKNRQTNFAKEFKMSVLTFEESIRMKKPAEKGEIVEVVIEIPDCEKKPVGKKSAKKAEEPKVEAQPEEVKEEKKEEEAPVEEKQEEAEKKEEAPKAKKSSKK